MRKFVFAIAMSLAFSSSSIAWDPIGDLRNPDRILKNIKREAENAGRTIDQHRREALVQSAAPGFEQWLNASRNTASNGGTYPIPHHIRMRMQGFYSEAVLNRARFKIGDAGVFNLAQLSISFGNASAVTLIDVIVFKNPFDANNNDVLWAHELKHVEQFMNWGTRNFAIRYLRSWNSVEGDATNAENAYRQRFANVGMNVGMQGPPPGAMMPVPAAARFCATPIGACPLMAMMPMGAPCQCSTMQGPVFGQTR